MEKDRGKLTRIYKTLTFHEVRKGVSIVYDNIWNTNSIKFLVTSLLVLNSSEGCCWLNFKYIIICSSLKS